MSKQDRNRKSAPHNRVKSFVDAEKEILPSSELNSDELVIFRAIIDSRETSTWTAHDIRQATTLAKDEAELVELREGYKAMGVYLEDHNGKPILNPLFTAYNTKYGQTKVARRDLGLSASQRSISGHKQAKRNQQDREAKATASNVSSLLAKRD
jgi:hypothetical protein